MFFIKLAFRSKNVLSEPFVTPFFHLLR